MASIINATTSTGLVSSADNSGSLQLATNNGTTAVTINTSQNVGIGTTSPASRLQIGDATVSTSNGIIFGKYNAASQTNLPAIRQGSFDGAAQDLILGASSGTGTVRFFTGAADSSLEFGTTSNAERMRISSAGYVTMPYQPAFLAYRTNGGHSGTGVYICNNFNFKDGSHYNSSTGRFTAPVAGRYQMNFFVLAQSGNNFDLNIRVNGTLHAGFDIRDNSALSGNFTLTTTAVLKLSANDIVDPYIASFVSGPIYGSGLNGFSMYFLG